MLENKTWKFFLIAYLATGLFYTFPLIAQMNSYLIGQGGFDGFQYMWNFYTFWNEISQFHSPFYTNQIFYPVGVNLFFSDFSSFSSLVGLPFLKFPVFYLNFLIIIGITFSGFITFYLVLDLTQKKLISFLSGLIYAISPSIGSNIYVQHNYYVLGALFLPLILLLLIRFVNRPGHYLKRLLLVSILLSFTNYYFFVLAFLMSGIFLLLEFCLNQQFRKKLFTDTNIHYYYRFGLIFITAVLILFGVVYSQTNDFGNWSTNKSVYAASCNANLAGFIIPPQNSFMFGISELLYERTSLVENGDTPYYYLGFLFIIIIFGGVWYSRYEKHLVSLFITGLVILVFSLGLVIRFGSSELFGGFLTPFFWLSQFPLLGLIDCPIRFVMGVHLFIGVLVGLVLNKLINSKKKLGTAVIIICFVSIFFDYHIVKFPFIKVMVPQVIFDIASIPGDKTVLELPSGLTESKGGYGYDWAISGLHAQELFWQSIHGKPRIGGYVSRIPVSTYDYFRSEPILSDIFDLTSLDGKWPDRKFSLEQKKQFIGKYNLGFIVIIPEARQQIFSHAVEQVLEGIHYEKKEIDGYLLYSIR